MERSLFRLSSMAVYVGLLFAPGVRSELATSAAYQTNAMDPESLVAAYHAAASKIFSFDLVMNTKSHAIIVVDRNGKSKLNTADQAENNKTSYRVLERPVVRSFVSKQVYKRGKFRTDLLEVDNAIKERDKILAAWNGVEAKAINRVAHSGIVSDFPNSNPGTFGFAYRQLYAYLRGSLTFHEFMRDRLPAHGVTARRDGSHIVLVAKSRAGVPLDGDPFEIHLYLNPDKGLMPEIVDLFLNRGGVTSHHARVVNQLGKFLPGIWAPASSKVSTYIEDRDSEFYGKEAGYFQIDLDVSRSKFNIPIADDLFDPKFEIGDRILDEREGKEYRLGIGNKMEDPN
jgi:hypothetical protein